MKRKNQIHIFITDYINFMECDLIFLGLFLKIKLLLNQFLFGIEKTFKNT